MKKRVLLLGLGGFLLGIFVIVLSFQSLTGFTIGENISRSAFSILGLTLIIGGLLICMQGSQDEPLEGRIEPENGPARRIDFELVDDDGNPIRRDHLNDPQRESSWKKVGRRAVSSPGRIAIAGIGAAAVTHYTVGDNLYKAGREAEHIYKMARVISKLRNIPIKEAYPLAQEAARQSLEQAQNASLQLPTVNQENPIVDAKTKIYRFLRDQFQPQQKEENSLRATPEYQRNYTNISKMRTLSLEKLAEQSPGTKEFKALQEYIDTLNKLDVRTISQGQTNTQYTEIIRHGREDLGLREDAYSALGAGLDVTAALAAAGVAIYAERKATKYARKLRNLYRFIRGK